MKKCLLVLFSGLICSLTFLNVSAESSAGGRHDHDGAICTDTECTTSIICSDSSYSNNCDSFLSPTIGNYTFYLTKSSYNNENKSALPSIKKIEAYGSNSLNISIPYFESTSKKFVDYLYDTDGNYTNRYLGGFYSPLLRGYFKKGIHYRYQYTLRTSDWSTSSLTPKSFDLSEFQNNTKIYSYDSELDSINGIDNYQISYHWNVTSDNHINIVVYCDFVPNTDLYEVYIVDGITPINDGVIGNRSNLYFSYFSSDGYNRSLEYVSNTAYLLRFTDDEYSSINKDNTITFYSDGSVSFENDIKSCSLTDISCHVSNLSTIVSKWFSFLGKVYSDILSVLTNLLSTISNAIKDAFFYTFVPTDDDFQSYREQLKEICDQHWGVLNIPLKFFYDIGHALGELTIHDRAFIIDTEPIGIGDMGTIIPAIHFDVGSLFEQNPYKLLYESYYVFVHILFTYWFILFLEKMYHKVFGG